MQSDPPESCQDDADPADGQFRPAARPQFHLIRARVISSFSASGVTGRNNPRCAERGGAGSALIHTLMTGAPGGWAANSNCSNFKNTLVSRMETGNRKVRIVNWLISHIVGRQRSAQLIPQRWWFPRRQPAAPVAGANGIPVRQELVLPSRAQSCSNSRFRTNDKGSRVSTGNSSSIASSKCEGWFAQRQRTQAFSASQALQLHSHFAQARSQSVLGQKRQGVKISYAPALQSIEHLFTQLSHAGSKGKLRRGKLECVQQNPNRQRAEPLRLFAGRNHSNSREIREPHAWRCRD